MPKSPTNPEFFEECKQITITSLKRLGYLQLETIVRSSYGWTIDGKISGWIYITANLGNRYIELSYDYGDKPIRYRVELASISKNFGGCEWYFICPATGKRCRTLYGIGELFLSRHAYPSAMYRAQAQSKRTRELLKPFRFLKLLADNEGKSHVRITYAGKLTKRSLRFLKRQAKLMGTEIDERLAAYMP